MDVTRLGRIWLVVALALLVWDGSLAGSTSYSPTFTQSTADSWYDAAAVIVGAT